MADEETFTSCDELIFQTILAKGYWKGNMFFLAGWEATFNGDEQCENFLATQGVDENTAKLMWSAIELVFEKDRLVEAFDYEYGERRKRHLETDEIGLVYKERRVNSVFRFIENNDGVHQLGGGPPKSFTLPEANTKVSFQYLGFFTNEDEAFHWLPFTLHLTCPIFLNFDKVFLDYENPDSPTIINKEALEGFDCSMEELTPAFKIVFQPLAFGTLRSSHVDEGLGHTGVPLWIQYPDIPRCPKSNKIMRFLCELKSNAGVEVAESNVVPSSPFMQSYFEKMNFWGDGDLYVFFEPTTKTACYLIQHT